MYCILLHYTTSKLHSPIAQFQHILIPCMYICNMYFVYTFYNVLARSVQSSVGTPLYSAIPTDSTNLHKCPLPTYTYSSIRTCPGLLQRSTYEVFYYSAQKFKLRSIREVMKFPMVITANTTIYCLVSFRCVYGCHCSTTIIIDNNNDSQVKIKRCHDLVMGK